MLKSLNRISTIGMSRDEWLGCRRASIGGSDAAAIIGLNEWSSPYRVWADKTGKMPETPDNESMRQGRDLEEYVARRWCEKSGKKVRRVNAILTNPAFPFAHANIDRLVTGEDAGLECKTTSALNLKRFKHGEYPPYYYVQCMHYMAVTGAARWYLAVLVLNKWFYVFSVERDEGEIESLMAQEAAFWKHVTDGEPPPADGSAATTGAIQAIYPDSANVSVDLFGRDGLIDQYFLQRGIKDEAGRKMEEIKQTLMEDLGANETGICNKYKVIWKPQVRKSFDEKRFANECPGIDLSGYYKETAFRKFEIKELLSDG